MLIGNLDAEKNAVAGATRLHIWLEKPKWDVMELVRFLRGDDVPATFANREPYEWIEHALANGGERADFERKLALRLGHLLDQEPEIKQFWPRSEQMLFNLFSVCANMHQPNELCVPLRQMMGRRALQSEPDRFDLRGRLRSAIASNQLDQALKPMWVAMTQGQVDFLSGNPFDGLNGLLLMPMDGDTPPLKDLSVGFRSVLPLIEKGLEEPRQVLSRLVRGAKNAYQMGREWVGYLLCRSCADAWPAWAREALIPLFECESCESEMRSLSLELDGFLPAGKDQLDGYAAAMGSIVQVWLMQNNRPAGRRFEAIWLPELDKINVGALVCV